MTERSTKGDQNMGQTSHQEKLNSNHSLGKILTDGKRAEPAMISPCRDFNGKERICRQVYVEHKVGEATVTTCWRGQITNGFKCGKDESKVPGCQWLLNITDGRCKLVFRRLRSCWLLQTLVSEAVAAPHHQKWESRGGTFDLILWTSDQIWSFIP